MLHVAADDARDPIEVDPRRRRVLFCHCVCPAISYRRWRSRSSIITLSMRFTNVIFGFPECAVMRLARGAREAVGLFRKEGRNPPTPGAKADARPVSRRQPNHRVGPVIRAKRLKQVLPTAPDRGIVTRSSARTAPRDYLNAFSGIADTGNHRA